MRFTCCSQLACSAPMSSCSVCLAAMELTYRVLVCSSSRDIDSKADETSPRSCSVARQLALTACASACILSAFAWSSLSSCACSTSRLSPTPKAACAFCCSLSIDRRSDSTSFAARCSCAPESGSPLRLSFSSRMQARSSSVRTSNSEAVVAASKFAALRATARASRRACRSGSEASTSCLESRACRVRSVLSSMACLSSRACRSALLRLAEMVDWRSASSNERLRRGICSSLARSSSSISRATSCAPGPASPRSRAVSASVSSSSARVDAICLGRESASASWKSLSSSAAEASVRTIWSSAARTIFSRSADAAAARETVVNVIAASRCERSVSIVLVLWKSSASSEASFCCTSSSCAVTGTTCCSVAVIRALTPCTSRRDAVRSAVNPCSSASSNSVLASALSTLTSASAHLRIKSRRVSSRRSSSFSAAVASTTRALTRRSSSPTSPRKLSVCRSASATLCSLASSSERVSSSSSFSIWMSDAMPKSPTTLIIRIHSSSFSMISSSRPSLTIRWSMMLRCRCSRAVCGFHEVASFRRPASSIDSRSDWGSSASTRALALCGWRSVCPDPRGRTAREGVRTCGVRTCKDAHEHARSKATSILTCARAEVGRRSPPSEEELA
mmetsp:Transcript_6542/g.15816  ORF Transcript_6542/g.15816 Transcript_6542/m.15816 type:complete len:622 (-) Transcript_6542:54-1919(-)